MTVISEALESPAVIIALILILVVILAVVLTQGDSIRSAMGQILSFFKLLGNPA